MTRKLFASLLLAASLTLLVAGASPAPPSAYACKQLQDGTTACGYAEVVGCGAGVAEGEATAPVQWTLAVYTNHGNAYAHHYGHAAALAATAPCWTDTCTTAVLYANGEEIHASTTWCLG